MRSQRERREGERGEGREGKCKMEGDDATIWKGGGRGRGGVERRSSGIEKKGKEGKARYIQRQKKRNTREKDERFGTERKGREEQERRLRKLDGKDRRRTGSYERKEKGEEYKELQRKDKQQ